MFKISFPVIKQLVAAISCNLLIFSSYTIFGWATINSNDLQRQNSTFPTGPLTFAEVSSVISVSSIGSLIGNFAVLPAIHYMGPKSAGHLFTIPLILSALLILYARNTYFLFASRILSGLASGGSVVSVQSFSIDISSVNVRAASNALYDLSENGGYIASFLLGNYLNALDQAKIYLIIPMILAALLFVYPESPEFWLRKGNYRQAKVSLTYYKGIVDDKNETESGAQENELIETSKLRLKDFFTPQAKAAIFISISLTAMYILCGTAVLLDYSAEIFARTCTSISPKSASLLVSLAKLTGNLIFLVVVEQCQRKTFFVGSTLASGVFFLLFGTYCSLWMHQPKFDWMPVFCAACISFSSGIGLSQMPFLIGAELFPKKIRSICISLMLCFLWLILFVIESAFPVLLNQIGLTGCLVTFGIICLLNAVVGSCIIPETRGKSYEEIMQMLAK